MKQGLVIRAAEPKIEEGRLFARFVMEITEGLFRYMLGRRPEEIIAATYLQPDNDLSHRNTIVAELDGVVVGIASGYTAEAYHRFSDRALKRAAGRRALRTAASLFLFAALFRTLRTHDAGDFYLHYIGVDKEYRGCGIGSALLTAMEDRARASGSNRFALDVAAKNKNAIGVYERFGFSVVSGWPRLSAVPKVLFRMAKSI